MTAYILTWNPRLYEWDVRNREKAIRKTQAGQLVRDCWSMGNRTHVERGDRVFLFRQVVDRGIVASGWILSGAVDAHWDRTPGKRANYAKLDWDVVLDDAHVVPISAVISVTHKTNWNSMLSSGVELQPPDDDALERLWAAHVNYRSPDEVHGVGFPEGAVTRVLVNRYERNPQARRRCIEHYGATCQVCGLDFAARYGSIGKGFIHVHHLRELSSIGQTYQVDPVADLRPVCPNCHAMLHTRTPAYSINELHAMLRQ